MRIVVWNCNMGLHRKLPVLTALKPDLAIVPECARLDTMDNLLMPPSVQWIGDLPAKGLGVLAFGDYSVALDACHNPDLKYFMPVQVSGPVNFRLLAVWAFNHRLPGAGRGLPASATGSVPRALDHYRQFLTAGPGVVAGDFNNHVRWDKPGNPANQANTVRTLESLGLASAYHRARSIPQGQEHEHTLYWRGGKSGPTRYHVDYCFVPGSWLSRITGVEVGNFEQWGTLSDHMPLIVDVAGDAGAM